MQLSITIFLAILASLTQDVFAAQADLLTALYGDIGSNLQEYLSFMSANPSGDYQGLLSLYYAAQTYTDDSYTTLANSAALASISDFATSLPWYTRIEAEAAGSATVSSTSMNSVSSTVESPSSAASSITAASSSLSEVGSLSSRSSSSEVGSLSSRSSSSAHEASTTSESSSSQGAAAGSSPVGWGLSFAAFYVAITLL